MKKLLFLIVLWTFTASFVVASIPPVVELQEGRLEYPLGQKIQILDDQHPSAEAPLTLEEVYSSASDSLFYTNGGSSVVFKDNRKGHWLRFRVKNNTENPSYRWLLSTDNYSSSIEVYLLYPDKTIKHKKANTTEQEIDDTEVVVDLELKPGEEVEVYLLVSNLNHHFSIREESAFYKYARIRDMLYSALFSIFFIMIVYNLILFVVVRDKSYLYYSLYCTGFILFQITMVGFGYQYLWPDYEWINAQVLSILGFTIFFGILAARSFLKIPDFSATFDRFMILILFLSGALVIGDLLNLPVASYTLGIGLSALTAVALFVAGILVWKKGYGPGRYYVLGWTLLLISVVIYFFSIVGLIPFNLFTSHVVKVASVVEIVFLSFGLADRINVTRREKHLAQEEVIATLQENEKIKDAANRDFKQKADELEEAYQALLESKDESAKLQELDLVKTRFFANISHEFRTPLTIILGQVDRFLQKPVLKEEEEQDYQLIYRNANRLLQLINQLLDLAKLEAGGMHLRAEQADVAHFLKMFVSSFSSLAETRGIKLEFVKEGSFIDIYVDKDKLEKTVGNLLSNALKFTGRGGNVTVSLKRVFIPAAEIPAVEIHNNEFFSIEVKDTGIGIKAEIQDKIFDRFYQVDTSYTKVYEGTGIGLALVKELVKVQYGEIIVESEEGKGTCFTILLPVGRKHLKAGEMIDSPLEAALAGFSIQDLFLNSNEPVLKMQSEKIDVVDEKPLLLIVEDNADVRSFIASVFQSNYRIVEAEDGLRGHQLAVEHIPDIVISDLMMPELDGFDLCKQLKQDDKTSHIPFILLTARASIESRIEGFETGADDYLVKPFKAAELLARARNLIEVRKNLQKLYSKELFLRPKEVAVNSVDERFIERIMAVLEEQAEDPEFTIEKMASEMGMSRTQLHRKLKALNGQSASEFLRNFRLQRAAQLLKAHYGNVAEVAYQVGFNNLSYFAKCFREVYGIAPSEFSRQRPVEKA